MNRALVLAAAFLFPLVLGACDQGSASATATDPEAQSKWSQYCSDEVKRQAACGTTITQASCLTTTLGSCVAGAFRASVVEPLISCLGSRACNIGDDPCLGQAASLYQNDPTVGAYMQMCLDKYGACGGTGFTDDYCGNLGLLIPSMLGEMSSCLSQDCSQARACLDSVLHKHGCK